MSALQLAARGEAEAVDRGRSTHVSCRNTGPHGVNHEYGPVLSVRAGLERQALHLPRPFLRAGGG